MNRDLVKLREFVLPALDLAAHSPWAPICDPNGANIQVFRLRYRANSWGSQELRESRNV